MLGCTVEITEAGDHLGQVGTVMSAAAMDDDRDWWVIVLIGGRGEVIKMNTDHLKVLQTGDIDKAQREG